MQKRVFSAKFKTELVLELLKGEKELNVVASENNISPNQLRNWKKEFLDNATAVFDNKKDEKLKEENRQLAAELEKSYTKVGRLSVSVKLAVP